MTDRTERRSQQAAQTVAHALRHLGCLRAWGGRLASSGPPPWRPTTSRRAAGSRRPSCGRSSPLWFHPCPTGPGLPSPGVHGHPLLDHTPARSAGWRAGSGKRPHRADEFRRFGLLVRRSDGPGGDATPHGGLPLLQGFLTIGRFTLDVLQVRPTKERQLSWPSAEPGGLEHGSTQIRAREACPQARPVKAALAPDTRPPDLRP